MNVDREDMIIIVSIMLGIIGTLLYIGNDKETVQKPNLNLGVCKIIIPHGKIEEGWKFRDPAEEGNISNLIRDGMAEIDELPGLVECTLYLDNQTPVTTSGALAVWRKR